MKNCLIITALLASLFAHGQLQKNDFIVGVELGFNNQVVIDMDDRMFWYAKGVPPLGLNLQFAVANRFSIGLRSNIAKMTIWYDDGYRELSEVSYWSLSNGLYGIYHWFNTEHCVIGSGLSIGYRSATYDFRDFTVGDEGIKYDVMLLDLKAIFVEHLGIQFNIYMKDNYSSFASAGLFWRF